MEKDDWRLTGQDKYLSGARVRRVLYSSPSATWDHDHCEFCWQKFMDRSAEARSRFVRDYTCPPERVTVGEELPTPPDEVVNAPERLRLWNEQRSDPDFRNERANGCGHSALYRCTRVGRRDEVMLCQPARAQ